MRIPLGSDALAVDVGNVTFWQLDGNVVKGGGPALWTSVRIAVTVHILINI